MFCGQDFLNEKRTDKKQQDLLGSLGINSEEIITNLKVETLGTLGTSNKSLKCLITQLFYSTTSTWIFYRECLDMADDVKNQRTSALVGMTIFKERLKNLQI